MTTTLTPGAALTLKVECAFGANPNTSSAGWTWTDVSKYVRGDITITKGRADEASLAEFAQATLTLDNSDGRFTQGNGLSPYWPNVKLNVPLRISVTWQGAGSTFERFTGFVAGWTLAPVSPNYTPAPIVAAGRLRLLERDGQPVQSPLTRTITSLGFPDAYWPLEDAPGSTQAASATQAATGISSNPMVVTTQKQPIFGDTDAPVGASSSVDFTNGGTLNGRVTSGSGLTWRVEFSAKVSGTAGCELIQIPGRGGAGTASWQLDVGGGSGQLALQWFDGFGGGTVTLSAASFNDGAWHRYRFDTTPSGGSVVTTVTVDGVVAISHTFGSVTNTVLTQIILNAVGQASAAGPQITQVAAWSPYVSSIDTFAANLGYNAETVDARLTRLCLEAGVPFTLTAASTPLAAMGPQAIDTFPALIRDAEKTDMGLLHDSDHTGNLVYVARNSRYSQAVQLTLNYLADQISATFSGTADDQNYSNSWQISRTAGGTPATYTDTVAAADVGSVLGQSDTLNLNNDSQSLPVAQWLTHLGVFKGYRFPLVSIDILNRSQELAAGFTALTLPAHLAVQNMPLPYPPQLLDQFAEGYTETIGAQIWQIDFDATPYQPWKVGIYDHTKYDSPGAVTNVNVPVAAIGATSTFGVLVDDVWTTDSSQWNPATNGPLYIIVDQAEVMQVTNISAVVANVQTFTVIRGINGITKAHGATVAVNVYLPGIYVL